MVAAASLLSGIGGWLLYLSSVSARVSSSFGQLSPAAQSIAQSVTGSILRDAGTTFFIHSTIVGSALCILLWFAWVGVTVLMLERVWHRRVQFLALVRTMGLAFFPVSLSLLMVIDLIAIPVALISLAAAVLLSGVAVEASTEAEPAEILFANLLGFAVFAIVLGLFGRNGQSPWPVRLQHLSGASEMTQQSLDLPAIELVTESSWISGRLGRDLASDAANLESLLHLSEYSLSGRSLIELGRLVDVLNRDSGYITVSGARIQPLFPIELLDRNADEVAVNVTEILCAAPLRPDGAQPSSPPQSSTPPPSRSDRERREVAIQVGPILVQGDLHVMPGSDLFPPTFTGIGPLFL